MPGSPLVHSFLRGRNATWLRAASVVKAIHDGDVGGLRQLLSDTPALAHARIVDRHGVARTLLHIVADWPGHFSNGPQTVATLVAAGAEVNAAVLHANSAETALHWAASSDDVGVLDALLDGGADIEAPGAVFTGGAPMSDAVVFTQRRAARRLLERGALTTIWQAAALGRVDAVRHHVAIQPPPAQEQITNAFWHACRGGQLAVATYLFQQGADMHWIGHENKAPLDIARESGVSALVQWLEDHGARSAATS
jgi:hypothetical protein